MKQKDKERKVTCCYVKLSSYMVPFMKKRHGGQVLTFSPLSKYNQCMINHLVCNKHLDHYYTDLSFSEYAYNLAKSGSGNQLSLLNDEIIPPAESLEQLVCVRIPDEVIALDDEGNPQAVETNSYYQLTRTGARNFRELVKNEFWTDLATYIYNEQHPTGVADPCRFVDTRKDLILKFLIYYGIDTDNLESIYRCYTRNVKSEDAW